MAAVFKPENVEDFYEIGEVLGSGHYGQVRRVKERKSGICWAGKFVKFRRSVGCLRGAERSSVEREVAILQAVNHPNVVTLKDVFQSRAEAVLILELVSGGELFDFIAEKENLMENEAIAFLKQILKGLRFLHSKDIAHFDLKPENIMLSEKASSRPKIKLIDFGLAHCFHPGDQYRSTSGTPQYIAPEVINYEPLSTAADMWSVGVITYILLSGLSPFQGESDAETLLNVRSLKFEFDQRYFLQTTSAATQFIQRLLVNDPRERMTAEECLLHPWIKPSSQSQLTSRNRSSINIKSFKRFNARRKWKMSYNMVRICNRLVNMKVCNGSGDGESLTRRCESDGEDTETKTASLLRRRLSSSS